MTSASSQEQRDAEQESSFTTCAAAALETQDSASFTSLYYEDDADFADIVVGYAFGPKKMSTMGVVMAEASKTKLTSHEVLSHNNTHNNKNNSINNSTHNNNQSAAAVSVSASSISSAEHSNLSPMHKNNSNNAVRDGKKDCIFLTRAAVLSNNKNNINSHNDYDNTAAPSQPQQQREQMDTSESSRLSHDAAVNDSSRRSIAQPSYTFQTQQQQQQQDTVVFTMDRGLLSTGAKTGDIGLRNIVRYFRSSCSSVEDSISTGTCTASMSSSTRTASTARHTTLSSSSSHNKRKARRKRQVRVSFVPLDMEVPLEDQHGGQMDVILHKLTEDILCLSQLSPLHPQLQQLSNYASWEPLMESLQATSKLNTSELAAIRRVHRLLQFQQQHPECSLVDNPTAVQTLMSRSQIATTLEACLQSVTSASGVPVRSPKSAVLWHNAHDDDDRNSNNNNKNTDWPKFFHDLQFPLIVKPLIAAGTKASHKMAILLSPPLSPQKQESWRRITTQPCLVQEYANHNALLYKVYVLGPHVSVHKRRSLPNLPRQPHLSSSSSAGLVLDFDSQRPYPRLADFGLQEEEEKEEQTPQERKPQPVPTRVVPPLTADEVRPVVDALKRAFGLQLFGFDIIVTETTASSPQMLVVDVNYFPSYKEVRNFPALLAQYLTDQAMEKM